jgi:hypothetical protein
MEFFEEIQHVENTDDRPELYMDWVGLGWVGFGCGQLNQQHLHADLRNGASSSTSSSSGGQTTITLSNTSVEDEPLRYKSVKVPVASSTPLQFWKKQSADYPISSLVARRLFCISASSTQSESDFSSVGGTVTDARSQLLASKVKSNELVR